MNDVKPCPFCGCDNIRIGWDVKNIKHVTYYAYCSKCNAKGPTSVQHGFDFWEKYKGTAIADWNKRISYE